MRGSEGGKATALVSRKRAEDKYNANPNFCKQCGLKIEVDHDKKVSQIARKKFCNSCCAAKFNNSSTPKRRKNPSLKCEVCGKVVYDKKCTTCSRRCSGRLKVLSTLKSLTKGELFSKRGGWQSARSSIQRDARQTYLHSEREKQCEVCGYTNHVEIAHIKSVSSFSDEDLISEINDLRNLIPLCPNHHWEYDAGILKFDAGEWNGLPFKTHTLEIPGSTPEVRNQIYA